MKAEREQTVYLTGGTHGCFDRVIRFRDTARVGSGDTLVILGDAGLNHYGDGRDALNKELLAELPGTVFCIHGNHEMRPGPDLGYEPVEAFFPVVDQTAVDKSTERWLGGIEERLDYRRWYRGHYHIEKRIDKPRFLFEHFTALPETL